ncbi:TIGR03668 family PPOX class F420-dependent oxidoreductase [Kribbella sp. NBC_01505]|uniref:TIGR03668 family PPOX class F420-dependent oxidoreductase n=1 Tax=Kribbella sp. NBC_01505 TaxID=2903580 RepID=UPI0038698674
MKFSSVDCRARFVAARVARLATVGADGVPHLVPVTFAVAVAADEVVIAIDQKPKSTVDLRRLRNIAANPSVALLVDSYDEDWTQLWWVRADGTATVLDAPPSVATSASHSSAVELLVAKYPQYAADPPRGPVIVVRVNRWSGWSFA